MKRGKDEDKNIGPMFPRLHVNDTEKGGPRAPPRNKMALYEQLSIPSQRFNGGVSTFNPNSTANSLPPSSSIPGPINERGTHHSDFNTQCVQQEHKDDDFRVPIFDQQSGTSQTRNANHQNRENGGFSGRLANLHNARQTNNKSQKENSQDFARSAASNQMLRQVQNVKVPLKETNGASSFSQRNGSDNLRGHRVDSQADNSLWGDSGLNENNLVQEEVVRSPNDAVNGDAVSETSMVDSICGVDISPDDVVGVIGQKHFWKARRAIVNQQRVFAVQVFELHRLIKVQKLIAGSPQLLFEENAYLSKPPKVSPVKKIPIEYLIKPKHKNDKNALEKTNDETEFSAENAVGKASLSSVQNGSQTTYCRPFSGNPLPPPSDPNMGSWNLTPPPGHQWLIPVMSPSEGLIYKPYPGPGFPSPSPTPSPVYGGFGPTPGSVPMIGHNFPNYGVPGYEGLTGVQPFAPPASHGYFPAYGMPPPANPPPPVSISRSPLNLQHQSSSNVQIDKNVVKLKAFKDREVQASTASSRSRNPLPLFPTTPPAPVEAPAVTAPVERVEPPRVIRVVPHNARSATASVARIFRSIQEERKQYDSG